MQTTEHTIRRDQLVAPADECINIDALLAGLEKSGLHRPEAAALMKRYLDLPIKLPIEDAPIRRLCELMTNNGCPTYCSCEGHGGYLPLVYFMSDDLNRVADLSYLLRKVTREKYFDWQVTVEAKYNSEPSTYPINFTLRPVALRNEAIDPRADREKLLFDIHYIGVKMLQFSRQNPEPPQQT